MNSVNSFGIIGGDKRQLYCAQKMAEDGFNVYISGFEHCSCPPGCIPENPRTTARLSDAVILPMPVSRSKGELFAPFSDGIIPLSLLRQTIPADKPVLCGINGAAEQYELDGLRIIRYSSREEFAAANAVPTAEGAVEIAMREYEGTINGADCLVTGYGNIGKILCFMLRGLGANVTAAARKHKDRALIRGSGMKDADIYSLSGHYDLIFNTVPALIFDRHTLAQCAAESIIIDLASMPGGIDDNAAAKLKIPVIHALSLPGKAAPKSAGIIIKNAVYNIIREEEL